MSFLKRKCITEKEKWYDPRLVWGFSLIELVTVLGMIIVLGLIIYINLFAKRGRTELSLTAQEIATLLRQAQSWSTAQASNTNWGVHFDNVTTAGAFYALFASSTYASSTDSGHYRLPSNVRYVTSTLSLGSSSSIIFARATGLPLATGSIAIELITGGVASATISVNQFGAISY